MKKLNAIGYLLALVLMCLHRKEIKSLNEKPNTTPSNENAQK